MTDAERIAELEKALEGAIWIDDLEARKLEAAWRLSPSLAKVVVAIYRARVPLRGYELDLMIPVNDRRGNRKYPDARDSNTIRVWVNKIRERTGLRICSKQFTGYWFEEEGRERVRAVLEA